MPEKTQPKKIAVLGRAVKMLFSYYPVLVPFAIAGIVFSALVATLPAIFLQQVTDAIDKCLNAGTPWSEAQGMIVPKVLTLLGFYTLSIIAVTVETQMAAVITQGYLCKMRQTMFEKMQDLPIRYFDTHKHGDIMSYYTNDIDTLRQLVGQSLPTLIRCSIIVVSVFFIMLYYSIWLTVILSVGVVAMVILSKVLGGGSAKYFIKLQRTIGIQEGYVQEMMNGQKVVKVFNHEKQSLEGFKKLNENLFQESYRANAYANMLGPIIMNIGNILYVIVVTVGCSLLINGAYNLSFNALFHPDDPEAQRMMVSVVVTFLSMTKQFTGNINQVSQQINSIVMAMAGAQRVFDLMDEVPEADEGYVTLVNAEIDENGNVTESERRTGQWAWKHPHGDGTLTYTPLRGDVRLLDVDFAYVEGKTVLHDVSVYAEPGQKVAFVGATGAGKTTITNLINRFYDIADGKIRYDGININKIRKSDLRRSLGIVLQDTNLFTGTVMENIRYGNLDATDEMCVNAAKLAGADDFITRLPGGYGCELTNNG
ncbi:MAG: ABC transporter ATP-binding protein/permease, partial [Clostridia bacterium]|nr:ABC transporter ATP-binding protein/permease [Clostridia bacterium]